MYDAAREKQFRARQHSDGTQQMEDANANTAAHKRDFGAEMVRHVATQHRCRYVAVQKCGQKSAAGRRVPDKFAILSESTAQQIQIILFPRYKI